MQLLTLLSLAPALVASAVVKSPTVYSPSELAEMVANGTLVLRGLDKRDCTSNNCVRAIRASAFPTRPGTADCSSYLMTTVTPATSTVYVSTTKFVEGNTVTVTTTQLSQIGNGGKTIKKRGQTQFPTAFPDYASACSSFAKYSSACSCVGVTGGVVTLPTPVTTVTVSSTSTTHSTATATATTSTFVLKLDSGSNAGQYVVMPAYINDSPYSDYSYFTSSSVAASAATKFYIDTSGILRPVVGIQQDAAQGGTVIMYPISDGYMGTVFAWGKANTASFSMYAMLDCTMGTGNQLVCGAKSPYQPNTFVICGNSIYFGNPTAANLGTCQKITLTMVPA